MAPAPSLHFIFVLCCIYSESTNFPYCVHGDRVHIRLMWPFDLWHSEIYYKMGGCARTTVICQVSPHSFEETAHWRRCSWYAHETVSVQVWAKKEDGVTVDKMQKQRGGGNRGMPFVSGIKWKFSFRGGAWWEHFSDSLSQLKPNSLESTMHGVNTGHVGMDTSKYINTKPTIVFILTLAVVLILVSAKVNMH